MSCFMRSGALHSSGLFLPYPITSLATHISNHHTDIYPLSTYVSSFMSVTAAVQSAFCSPTSQPSGQPTGQRSGQRTGQPKGQPKSQPTSQPSMRPSGQPTSQPSGQPTPGGICTVLVRVSYMVPQLLPMISRKILVIYL